jgi:hypothetical protein
MKKTFIILCLLASITAQAQYDTLPYNIGIPNYFTTHALDSMHVTSHDNRFCVPQASNLIRIGFLGYYVHVNLAPCTFVPYANDGDIAFGYYPDSTIHVIGMAWYNVIDSTVFGINPWDTIEVKLFHPSGNYMMPLVKKRISHDTFSFSKVLDLGRGWDASDITNWSVFNVPAPLYEVYFDNEIDISDSLYLSVKYTWNQLYNKKNWDVTVGWTEAHEPMYADSDPKIYPILSYRMKDTPGDDDPWTYGEMYAYPLLFPIIRLEGDTCPEVREVRYTRVGNSAAIAQWDAGTNHRDWQLCYGPQGFDPEGADVVNTTVPQRALTGLSATGRYDVYVKARCRFARDEWTPWAGPFSFSMSEIGIEDGPATIEFSVTPNPSHSNATVRCDVGMMSVELLSVKGDIVQHHDLKGDTVCTLDLAGIAKGVYVVVIATPQGTSSRKLVVE